MNFSITFGTGNDQRNTWTDWKMIPSTPPMVPPPEPNTNLVEIPGRAAGPIDLSTYPFGKITYKRITGNWTFYVDPVNGHSTRTTLYESVRRWLHGRETRAVIQEDPAHYYKGRFTVSVPVTGQGPIQISIAYSLEPLRYNVSDDSVDSDWVSDWH